MALRKQKVSVILTKGVQTKIDHKALPVDSLVKFENGEINNIGRIDKRTGFTKTAVNARGIIAYGDDLISRNIRPGEGVASSEATVYSESNSEFRGAKGFSSGWKYETIPVSKGSSHHQADPQTTVSPDGKYALITFVSYDEERADVSSGSVSFEGTVTKRCSVVDRSTGTVIASDIKIGASTTTGGHRMRSVWLNGGPSGPAAFYIIGEEAGGINVWKIDPTEDVIQLRDDGGAVTVSGANAFIGALYPLTSGASFPYDTTGASFDIVAHETTTTTSRVYLIKTKQITSTQFNVAMYQLDFDGASGSLSSTPPPLFDYALTAGVHSTARPTYYSAHRNGDTIYFAHVDGDKMDVRKTTQGSSTNTSIGIELLLSNAPDFTLKTAFVDNGDKVDLYSEVRTEATVFPGSLISTDRSGIHHYEDIDTNGLSGRMGVSNHGLAFAFSHGDENPLFTLGAYERKHVGGTPFPLRFDRQDSLEPLETIKLWTTSLALSVLVDGKLLTGKNYPRERDYLKYGSLEQTHIHDVLGVDQPGKPSGITADIDGRLVSVPMATNYNTFDGEVVPNSVIHLVDFRVEERETKPAASSAMLQDVLYVADNGLFSYDGNAFNLHGILARPKIASEDRGNTVEPTGSGTNPATPPWFTGDLDSGMTYGYRGVFEWEDALGNLHQSEPSSPVILPPEGIGTVNNVGLTEYWLTFPRNDFATEYTTSTAYDAPPEIHRDIRYSIYRTQGDGSTYNLNKSVNNFHRWLQEKGHWDGLSDDVNRLGRFLYTDTGELVNAPPPSPAIYVTAHKNRLFIIGKDRKVYYSKLATPGFGLGFHAAFEVKMQNTTEDPPTALGSMDGVLYIFTERSIYYVGGEGPDNLGTGGFYEAKRLPSPVGASYCSPVQLTDDGLFFSSGQGIYAIDRSGKITEVGAPADALFGSDVVKDMKVDHVKKTVYFQTSANNAELITYNYSVKQWGKHVIQGEGTIDSIEIFKGRLAVSTGDKLCFGSDLYKDDTSYVPLKIRTAWIKLDTYKGVHKYVSLQGYQRIYNFQILGESKDAHNLHVNVYYDYDEDTAFPTDTYTYSTTTTGTNTFQIKGHLSKQKCNSIQFEIYDADDPTNSTTGEGFTITQLELEVGQKLDQYKDGLKKIPSTSTIGAN